MSAEHFDWVALGWTVAFDLVAVCAAAYIAGYLGVALRNMKRDGTDTEREGGSQ